MGELLHESWAEEIRQTSSGHIQRQANLTARPKLVEAQFFLDGLRSVPLGSSEFRFYSSAFVSALHSSLQHLLYDHANTYWPNFGRDEYLDAEYFKLLAKAANNDKRLQFANWYNGLAGRIEFNDDAKLVWNIRKMEAHRGSPSLRYEAVVLAAIDLSARLEYGVLRASGEFTSTGSTPPSEQTIKKERGSSMALYFQTDKRDHRERKHVPDVFKSGLRFVVAILSEAETQFRSR